MSRYQARHRIEPDSLGAVQRTLTTASLGVLATTAIAGTTAAWACPNGGHSHTRASVHQAVSHGHASTSNSDRRQNEASAHSSSHGSGAQRSADSSSSDSSSRGSTAHHGTTRTSSSGESAGATRGASPSDPDGMSNGGSDKPWGAAAANDDVDGNNGSGNDLDCEDDNNGVGTPGHCGIKGESGGSTEHAHGHGGVCVHVSESVSGEVTIVVVLHNGETATVTVTAPAIGETILVPVTVNGVTVTVAVTGTSTGATAVVAGTPAGSTGNHNGTDNGSGATQVLGERVSRGLRASAPMVSSSLATPAAAVGAGTSASVSPTSTALPFTGSNDGVIALIGVSSVITGAGIVRASRRRSRRIAVTNATA